MTAPSPGATTKSPFGQCVIIAYGPCAVALAALNSLDALHCWLALDGKNSNAEYYRLHCSIDVDLEKLEGKMGFRQNIRDRTSVQCDGVDLIVTAPTVPQLVKVYNWVFDGEAGMF